MKDGGLRVSGRQQQQVSGWHVVGSKDGAGELHGHLANLHLRLKTKQLSSVSVSHKHVSICSYRLHTGPVHTHRIHTHFSYVGGHQGLHEVQQRPLQVGVSSHHHGQSFLDGQTDVRLFLDGTIESGTSDEDDRRVDRDSDDGYERSFTHLTHGLKKLLDQSNVLSEELGHAARGGETENNVFLDLFDFLFFKGEKRFILLYLDSFPTAE